MTISLSLSMTNSLSEMAYLTVRTNRMLPIFS